MKKLLYFILGASFMVAGTVFAGQISVPSSPGYGYMLIGQLTGNYTPVATSSTNFFTLTTSGSSGAATYSGGTLNIPQYVGGSATFGTTSISALYPLIWDTSTAQLSSALATTSTNTWVGQMLLGSSTIGSGTQIGGLTISGGATTTGTAYIGGNLGIGSTSPFAQLSVYAGGDFAAHAASTLFAIGSSTGGTATSTLFSVNSAGLTWLNNLSASGSSTIGGLLNATNGAQLASTTLFGATLLGNATGTTLAITGSTTVSGLFNATGGGFLNITGATTSALSVTASSTIGGTLNSTYANLLASTTLFGSTLFGSATSSGSLYITASTTHAGALNSTVSNRLASSTLYGNTLLTNATTTSFEVAQLASTTKLIVSSAGGTGTRCAQFAVDGTISATSAACGSGTITSITAGTGLNGGIISSSGTLSLKSYVATSSAETASYIPVWASTTGTPAQLTGGTTDFQFNSTTKKLTATYASSTALTATTLFSTDPSVAYSGIVSPVHALVLQTGTTTTWTATTSGAYIPYTVAPFAGTLQDVSCITDASFLGTEIDIAGSAAAPSYFVASTTAGTVSFTGSNTFTKGQKISLQAGTTTTATALSISCTIRATQTQ